MRQGPRFLPSISFYAVGVSSVQHVRYSLNTKTMLILFTILHLHTTSKHQLYSRRRHRSRPTDVLKYPSTCCTCVCPLLTAHCRAFSVPPSPRLLTSHMITSMWLFIAARSKAAVVHPSSLPRAVTIGNKDHLMCCNIQVRPFSGLSVVYRLTL